MRNVNFFSQLVTLVEPGSSKKKVITIIEKVQPFHTLQNRHRMNIDFIIKLVSVSGLLNNKKMMLFVRFALKIE
jgi:hypothetical protein